MSMHMSVCMSVHMSTHVAGVSLPLDAALGTIADSIAGGTGITDGIADGTDITDDTGISDI